MSYTNSHNSHNSHSSHSSHSSHIINCFIYYYKQYIKNSNNDDIDNDFNSLSELIQSVSRLLMFIDKLRIECKIKTITIDDENEKFRLNGRNLKKLRGQLRAKNKKLIKFHDYIQDNYTVNS